MVGYFFLRDFRILPVSTTFGRFFPLLGTLFFFILKVILIELLSILQII